MDVRHYKKSPGVGVTFVSVRASMPVIEHKGEMILGEERVSFSSQFHHVTAPSLWEPWEPQQGLGGRESSRDHGGTHPICPHGLLGWLSYITQDQLLRAGTTYSDWDLLHQSSIKKMLNRLAYRIILWRHISIKSLLPSDSSFCQADKKKKT